MIENGLRNSFSTTYLHITVSQCTCGKDCWRRHSEFNTKIFSWLVSFYADPCIMIMKSSVKNTTSSSHTFCKTCNHPENKQAFTPVLLDDGTFIAVIFLVEDQLWLKKQYTYWKNVTFSSNITSSTIQYGSGGCKHFPKDVDFASIFLHK